MKILRWLGDNVLFILTLFLLAFIPLYPKIPLIGVTNTWVYIRAEDFIVVVAILIWFALIYLKKVTLKTPLTIPIMFFWIIGGLATIHGVLLLFPTLANVFSNVAFFSFLRRIEYMSLFFIAFLSIKSKKQIFYVAIVLIITLLLIIGYGFGQRFLGFPAFLTMNEEAAKGVPVYLSALSRIPSTFAGHYDLAAYLVLIIPLLVSLAFGFKNIIVKLFLFIVASLGFVLLFMTVSRVSFVVLLLSLLLLLLLQKKRVILISFLVLTCVLLVSFPSLLQRFQNTMSQVDVLVNAKTGEAIGEVKDTPASYFKDKIVKRAAVSNEDALNATDSARVPFESIPPIASLVVEANRSTGENLPQGTSYVNLALSPVVKKVNVYFFQKLTNKTGIESEDVRAYYGNFLVKKARAYDLSFTTRFQGEWPNTFEAFKRNIFLGSGYGSVSLAVDNNYLRILGESGLLGFISFISIFIIALIYISKLLPKVDSPIAKSFIIGFVAGSFGLGLNAFLIDVFEASKIAYTYWLLMGVVLGTLLIYKKEEIDPLAELKKVATSPFAVITYIFILVTVFFSPMISNYFVGDDFTWLRWASSGIGNITNYFTQADGFFYRPGTKIYFSLMYSAFWLNQAAYHLVSIFLHFAVSVVVFLILKRIFKNYALTIIATALFLVTVGYHEIIFWIASTGHLFNALFILLGLYLFILWKEKRKIIYFIASFISVALSMLFHELGIVAPMLIILYDSIFGERIVINKLSRITSYLILLFPILPYLGLRFLAQSHWFNGDYSYNLLKLPYNILGNALGYFAIDLFGPQSLPFYETLRNLSKQHLVLAIPITLAIVVALFFAYRAIVKKIEDREKKIILFGVLFFLIGLLPFLGFGNITSRYSYLSSVGFVILLAIFLKKIGLYFINVSNKHIGIACIMLVAITYFMVQSFELQKIQTDWGSAGNKAQRFLVSIEENSNNTWLNGDIQLYFVNLPIRNGEAWIWPVGLKDALWFTFKNPNISVNLSPDLQTALGQAGDSFSAYVFTFNDDGSVTEVQRVKKNPLVLSK